MTNPESHLYRTGITMDRTLPHRRPKSDDQPSPNIASLQQLVNRVQAEERLDRSPEDVIADEISQLRKLAWLMDESITIPGTGIKIGLDGIIGMVPGIGDIITAGVSSYIIRKAHKLGVSKMTLMRMIGNTTVDVVAGVVPVVGDLFDYAWKSNRRNAQLLIKHLEKQQKHKARNKRA